MTEKYLKSLLDKLNKKKADELIQLRPLSSTVDFAKVWIERPTPKKHTHEPYNFYFIKNQEGVYVGTVLDTNSELHWFVDKKRRKQGHLTGAMKQTILFHLFQTREEQRISIDEKLIGKINFKSSENVALSLGFIKTGIKDYVLSYTKYQREDYIHGQNTPMSEARMKELKNQINYLGNSLWLIHSEIEMKLGYTDYAEELKELVDQVKKHTWKLEDAWRESKNQTV